MTKEAQRIAIAEACGFKEIVTTADYRKELVGVDTRAMKLVHRGRYLEAVKPIPDYLNDLNAMAEAVKWLSDEQYNDVDGFTYKLAIACGYTPEHGFDFRPMQEATAPQRAEAFLRTLRLWKESP